MRSDVRLPSVVIRKVSGHVSAVFYSLSMTQFAIASCFPDTLASTMSGVSRNSLTVTAQAAISSRDTPSRNLEQA